MSLYRPKGSPFYHFDFQWRRRRFYGSTKRTNRREAETVEQAEREHAKQAAAHAKAASTSLQLHDVAGRYWKLVYRAPDHRMREAELAVALGLSRGEAGSLVSILRKRGLFAPATGHASLSRQRRAWRPSSGAPSSIAAVEYSSRRRTGLPRRTARSLRRFALSACLSKTLRSRQKLPLHSRRPTPRLALTRARRRGDPPI
jgi:hypothetical protein